MTKKKYLKTLLSAAAVTVLAASCLNDEDPYNAGFTFQRPSNVYTFAYANNTADSVVMLGLGDWSIAPVQGGDWCKMGMTSGKGQTIYKFPVSFTLNTTGQFRYAQFRVTDIAHTDITADWAYVQCATRGDGSLGNAPQVKSITSSDGYTASIEYDELSRPVSYVCTTATGDIAGQLTISYNDMDSLLTVSTPLTTLRGSMDKGYQAERLTSTADTVGYYAQRSIYGNLPATTAFNFESRGENRTQRFAYLLNGQSLSADSIHNADSLKYERQWKIADDPEQATRLEKLKLTYSNADNRCQTVDVNQLLLGMDDCHPMLLLSMFRYARNSNIISRASSATGDITVSTELNANKSVSKLTVSDERTGKTVTYTLSY